MHKCTVSHDEAAGKKRKKKSPLISVSSSSTSSSTTCTTSSSSSSSSSSSNGTAAAKRAKSDHCTWTGKLCEAKQHFNECEYAGALCGFGCGAVVRRIDKSVHKASICPKREMQCTNVGCNAVMHESKMAAHTANDCLYEVVDCPFSSVGCKERMLRKDIESHEDAAMKQNNRLLLQDKLSLKQKVNAHLHQIVHKVELADLTEDGEVDMSSNHVTIGVYSTCMLIRKGYAHNQDCYGLYLHFSSGPFPCRVFCTLEVVHWDGKSESNCKKEINEGYDKATNYGRHKLIPLSKLTAATSPYVKDGDVTFICTFRILPVE